MRRAQGGEASWTEAIPSSLELSTSPQRPSPPSRRRSPLDGEHARAGASAERARARMREETLVLTRPFLALALLRAVQASGRPRRARQLPVRYDESEGVLVRAHTALCRAPV